MNKNIIFFVTLLFLVNNERAIAQGCVSHSRSSNKPTSDEVQLRLEDSDLENYCRLEFQNISWMLQINSNLYFFEDNPIDSYYNNKTNNLVLGKNMIHYIISKYGYIPDEPGFSYGSILPFLIAHEAGHAKAKKMGWFFKTGQTVKKDELFADFCAGMYSILQRKIVNSNSDTRYYGAFDIEPILDLFKSLGDWEFNNPEHHGTPEERKIAIIEGYNFMSNYIFNYQRNNNTNEIPLVSDIDLLQAVSRMLDELSD